MERAPVSDRCDCPVSTRRQPHAERCGAVRFFRDPSDHPYDLMCPCPCHPVRVPCAAKGCVTLVQARELDLCPAHATEAFGDGWEHDERR